MAMRILTVACLFTGVLGSEISPVKKVLQMMGDMKTKAIHERDAEQVGFAKFSTFCENTQKSKTKAIAEGQSMEEQLTADIMKAEADAKVLSEEIAKLDGSISLAEEDRASATEMRAKEHKDYEATHAEYVENIDDLQVGTSKLKTMMNHAPGAAASLIQTMATKITNKHAKTSLLSFLAESQSSERMLAQDVGLEVTAPEAAAYEGQSGGIINMMEELQAKLEDEKETLEKEEANARHSCDMMKQSLTDKIEQDSQTRSSKVSQKKGKEQAAAEAKGELSETQNTLAEDTKYLEDLEQLYLTKKTDFAARQQLRQGELEALDKAMEIIGSGAVSGAADTHLPASFAQKGTALVQLRSGSKEPSQAMVAQFLQAQGKRVGSQLLAALAIRARDDPFGKVKKMIKDMIIKLTEEATEEAEHKGFCDTELTTNKQTRDAKTTSVQQLTAEIEQLTAEVQQLTVENKDLSEQIADIDKAVAEATEQRNAEKAKNAQTISDAVAAKNAVEQAMSVLKTFYDKASTATALSQQGPIEYDDRAIAIMNRRSFIQTGSKTRGPADDVPETFDKPFTGMGGEGGILGMLEVILSDFERLEEETSTSEATATKDHTTFMADSQEDKAVKTADMNHNQNLITKRNSDNASAKKDLKSTQAELDAALEYYEKLKPSCVDAGESYEERVQRRKDEIQSLGEALKILAP